MSNISPDRLIRQMPNRYSIRRDQAITIPSEILTMLDWQIGDRLKYELNLADLTLKLTKSTDEASDAEEALPS